MLRLLTIAACALALGSGFAVAAQGGARSGKVAALRRLDAVATTDSNTEPVAPPDSARRAIQPRMLGPGAPIPIPPSVLHVRNGWLASDGRTLVAVYAGSAGNDRSVGRLVVVRQNLASGTQSVRIVDTGKTGSLAIDGARLGRPQIRTAGGRLLRLDLGTGTMARPTLTRSSRSAATVPPPQRPRSSDQVSYPHDR